MQPNKLESLVEEAISKVQLTEDFLSGYEYEIPKDKEKLLYDFYMSTLLFPPPTSGPGAVIADEDLAYTVEHTRKKLYDALKKELLNAVFFSLSAEIRHVFDRDNFDHFKKYLTPEEQKIFKKYAMEWAAFQQFKMKPDVNFDAGMREVAKRMKENKEDYYYSTKAALVADPSRRKMVEIYEKLYDKADWRSSYGGPAWAKIAKAWLKLDDAQDTLHQMVWIDHVYDLQHNTDTVFNKLKSYTKSGSYSWIKKALDYKFQIKNPYELFQNNRISYSMRTLAGYAIKNWKNTTLNDWLEKNDPSWAKAAMAGSSLEDMIGKVFDGGDLKPEDLKPGQKLKIKSGITNTEMSKIGMNSTDIEKNFTFVKNISSSQASNFTPTGAKYYSEQPWITATLRGSAHQFALPLSFMDITAEENKVQDNDNSFTDPTGTVWSVGDFVKINPDHKGLFASSVWDEVGEITALDKSPSQMEAIINFNVGYNQYVPLKNIHNQLIKTTDKPHKAKKETDKTKEKDSIIGAKVGDRVITNEEFSFSKGGQTGTITKIEGSYGGTSSIVKTGEEFLHIKWDDAQGKSSGGWYAYKFNLVESKEKENEDLVYIDDDGNEIKVGDYVKLATKTSDLTGIAQAEALELDKEYQVEKLGISKMDGKTVMLFVKNDKGGLVSFGKGWWKKADWEADPKESPKEEPTTSKPMFKTGDKVKLKSNVSDDDLDGIGVVVKLNELKKASHEGILEIEVVMYDTPEKKYSDINDYWYGVKPTGYQLPQKFLEPLKELEEGYLGGSYDYKLPTDKEQMLYDFYLSTLLFEPPIEGPSAVIRPGASEELSEAVKRAKTRLYDALKEELLNAVFFSLTAEIRHFFDSDRFESVKKILTPEEVKIFENYAKKFAAIKKFNIEPTKRTDLIRRLIKDSSENYVQSYKAALSASPDKKTFVQLMEKLYNKANWNSSFGGKAWANIAKAWLKLDEAKDDMHKMIWIDHVYDLQHNTDTVFNKIRNYTKEGNYRWIKKALDNKFKIKSPWEMWDKISHSMKELAAPAFKAWKGETLEQYLKDNNITLQKPRSILDLPKEKKTSGFEKVKVEGKYADWEYGWGKIEEGDPFVLLGGLPEWLTSYAAAIDKEGEVVTVSGKPEKLEGNEEEWTIVVEYDPADFNQGKSAGLPSNQVRWTFEEITGQLIIVKGVNGQIHSKGSGDFSVGDIVKLKSDVSVDDLTGFAIPWGDAKEAIKLESGKIVKVDANGLVEIKFKNLNGIWWYKPEWLVKSSSEPEEHLQYAVGDKVKINPKVTTYFHHDMKPEFIGTVEKIVKSQLHVKFPDLGDKNGGYQYGNAKDFIKVDDKESKSKKDSLQPNPIYKVGDKVEIKDDAKIMTVHAGSIAKATPPLIIRERFTQFTGNIKMYITNPVYEKYPDDIWYIVKDGGSADQWAIPGSFLKTAGEDKHLTYSELEKGLIVKMTSGKWKGKLAKVEKFKEEPMAGNEIIVTLVDPYSGQHITDNFGYEDLVKPSFDELAKLKGQKPEASTPTKKESPFKVGDFVKFNKEAFLKRYDDPEAHLYELEDFKRHEKDKMEVTKVETGFDFMVSVKYPKKPHHNIPTTDEWPSDVLELWDDSSTKKSELVKPRKFKKGDLIEAKKNLEDSKVNEWGIEDECHVHEIIFGTLEVESFNSKTNSLEVWLPKSKTDYSVDPNYFVVIGHDASLEKPKLRGSKNSFKKGDNVEYVGENETLKGKVGKVTQLNYENGDSHLVDFGKGPVIVFPDSIKKIESKQEELQETLDNPLKTWKNWKNPPFKDAAHSGEKMAKKAIKRWNDLATGKTPDANFTASNREPMKQLKEIKNLEDYINVLDESITTNWEMTSNGKFFAKLNKKKVSNIKGRRVDHGSQGSISERKMPIKEQFRRGMKAAKGNLKAKVRGKLHLGKAKKITNAKINPFAKS